MTALLTSTQGTLNMLGLAKRCGARMLLASSSAVYGDPLPSVVVSGSGPVSSALPSAAAGGGRSAGLVGKGKSSTSGGRIKRSSNSRTTNSGTTTSSSSSSGSSGGGGRQLLTRGSSSSSSTGSPGSSSNLVAYKVVTVDESSSSWLRSSSSASSSSAATPTSELAAFAEGKRIPSMYHSHAFFIRLLLTLTLHHLHLWYIALIIIDDTGKRAAETLVYAYAIHHRQQQHQGQGVDVGAVDVRVARIFDTYGPRMPLPSPLPHQLVLSRPPSASTPSSLSSSMLMGQFIAQALQGRDITVTATPSTISPSSTAAGTGGVKPRPRYNSRTLAIPLR